MVTVLPHSGFSIGRGPRKLVVYFGLFVPSYFWRNITPKGNALLLEILTFSCVKLFSNVLELENEASWTKLWSVPSYRAGKTFQLTQFGKTNFGLIKIWLLPFQMWEKFGRFNGEKHININFFGSRKLHKFCIKLQKPRRKFVHPGKYVCQKLVNF